MTTLGTSVRDLLRWYAQPLAPEDGHTADEIAAVEATLGVTLPAVLVEWYRLVGRRLRATQDTPVLLHELVVEDGAVAVWRENQGVWTIVAPLGADDPICRAGSDVRGPLSSVLIGMLTSDTLVSVWARIHGESSGPLGEFADTVRGGYIEDFDEDTIDRVDEAYAALPGTQNPFFSEPFRGDSATLVRAEDIAIEWATLTEDALVAFDHVVGLEPDQGAYEIRLKFTRLSAAQLRVLSVDAHGIVSSDVIHGFLGGEGRVVCASAGDPAVVDVATREPEAVLRELLARVPDDVLARLTIDVRPSAISMFTRLYPKN